MAGYYTEITDIVAPSSAAAGETVPVTIKIKNIWTGSFRVYAVGVLDTYDRFIDWLDAWVSPGITHSFSGSFVMPANDVTIHAFSYYKDVEGIWHKDDEDEKDVSLTVEVEFLDSRKITLEPLTVAEIELLDTRVVALEPLVVGVEFLDSRVLTLEPLVVGVELLDTRVIILEPLGVPLCTPGETKCIGADLYQCSPEKEWVLIEENSPECIVEEKKFPWLLLAVGGGAAAVAVAAAAKKKKKP